MTSMEVIPPQRVRNVVSGHSCASVCLGTARVARTRSRCTGPSSESVSEAFGQKNLTCTLVLERNGSTSIFATNLPRFKTFKIADLNPSSRGPVRFAGEPVVFVNCCFLYGIVWIVCMNFSCLFSSFSPPNRSFQQKSRTRHI